MSSKIALTINDRHYVMTKMSPIQAAPFATVVMAEMSKVLSNSATIGAMDNLLKKMSVNKENEEVKVDDNSAMSIIFPIMSLLSALDPEKVTSIFKKALSSDVYIEEQKLSSDIVFHEHFQKYAGDYYPVAIWATWNHVKDFFAGIGDGMTSVFKSLKSVPAPTITK